MPTMIDLEAARKQIEVGFLNTGQIHSVGIGLREVNGVITDEPCVQVVTGKKLTSVELRAASVTPLPKTLNGVKVDVIEDYVPKTLQLLANQMSAHSVTDLQKCFDCPIPGGAQMAPTGANWVGTLGCLLQLENNTFYADTNYHVAVGAGYAIGHPMVQPAQGSQWFAKIKAIAPIKFNDPAANNELDYVLLDTYRTGGRYGEGTHTVGTRQFEPIGAFSMEVTQPELGEELHKVGRTTGYTEGRCIGLNFTVSVNYGQQGTARFVNQLVVKAHSGNFSGPGDSGSTIIAKEGNQLWGKLFAGGGGRTIANPYQKCLDFANGHN